MIMGGLYIVDTIIVYGIMVAINKPENLRIAIHWSLMLVLGILGIVFGIRDIRHKEIVAKNLGSLDNP